jgi:hypothetical protein
MDNDKKHDKEERGHKADKPTEPAVQEYPKMLYHEDGRTQIVNSKEEEAQWTKDGFVDTPQAPKAEKK